MLLNTKRVIALRFAVELDHFAEALQDLGFDVVKRLNDLAFEVETLADFELALQEAEMQPNSQLLSD